MKLLKFSIIFLFYGCTATHLIKKDISNQHKSFPVSGKMINIDSLVTKLNPLSARDREKIMIPLMLAGNIPAFNLQLKKIKFIYTDSSGKKYKAVLFVSPDYLSFGNTGHFMRIPLTPQAAQQVADALHCMLPTRKIADLIYINAAVKLEPHPLTEKRDSLQTFLQHHYIIQNQLQQGITGFNHRVKIIAGIKKDVVQTASVFTASKPNRVAIYGWHQLNGKAIQSLYTGHVDWYVDYSHGIRLVYEKMIVNGNVFFIKDILNDPVMAHLICDEEICRYSRYKELKKSVPDHYSLKPGPVTNLPGLAPVCSPSFKTRIPFTNTSVIPSAY